MRSYEPTHIKGDDRCGASAPIRGVVSHWLQSADSGRSPDEWNRPGGPIVVIRQCSADHPDRQPVVTRADHGIIRPESPSGCSGARRSAPSVNPGETLRQTRGGCDGSRFSGFGRCVVDHRRRTRRRWRTYAALIARRRLFLNETCCSKEIPNDAISCRPPAHN